ncbi:MAG: hypothetical protein Q8L04_16630, partial [Ignavibacteria bacterium]|nr:hypothetical protein [Ignavibacteria bacterium]
MKFAKIFLLLATVTGSSLAQTIWIKDVNSRLVSKASVSVQVTYKETQFLLEEPKEKFFTAVTDTL